MTIQVTASEFRASQSALLEKVASEPVEIMSRGVRPKAVVVSPRFFERALAALEDYEDARAAHAALQELEGLQQEDLVRHEELLAEFGLA